MGPNYSGSWLDGWWQVSSGSRVVIRCTSRSPGGTRTNQVASRFLIGPL